MLQSNHTCTTYVFFSLDDYSYPPSNLTSNIRNIRLPIQIAIDISSKELANFRFSNSLINFDIDLYWDNFHLVNTMNCVSLIFSESLLSFSHLASYISKFLIYNCVKNIWIFCIHKEIGVICKKAKVVIQ